MRLHLIAVVWAGLVCGVAVAQPSNVPATSAAPTAGVPDPSAAGTAAPVNAADWRRLQQWRFGVTAIPVPPDGVVIRRDTATWTLESGTVALMEPVGGGRVTGLVFEGKGRFRMEIPDRFEVAQLRRFTDQPAIERIDEPFVRLVLRTTGPLPPALAAAPPPLVFAPYPLARDRHETWLKRLGLDVDARIIAGILTPGDDYLLVDAETAGFGWLMYEWNPASAQEPISLVKLQKTNDFAEQWVSLDRPEDRDAAGRPTASRRAPIHVTHVDIDVDLTKHKGSAPTLDRSSVRDKAFFRCRMTFRPLVDGPRALCLRLEPGARVTSVHTIDGRPLESLRDHIGARFASIDNEIYDESLVVLLDRPLAKGEERQLEVEYEMKTYNYVSGRGWYPGPGSDFTDDHTARLTFTMPKKFDVRAVGAQESERVEGDVKKAVWVVEKPTFMVAYSFGEHFKEERLKIEGVPEVVSFGTSGGLFSGGMVRNVGVDVVNSLNFYQQYFDVKIPAQRIYATAIQGDHGQAFDGFLHLSAYTYDAEHPGASELFRAHEAAHQIWGHMVRPKSYRDNWLSEGFAEYSAMLFIEATMAKDRYYDEIVDIYSNEQIGSLAMSFSKFARPWAILVSSSERKFVGPVAAGFRASAARVPAAWYTQTYDKGALVLHMLRALLSHASATEDVFRSVMRDFLKQYNGREASTADFQRVLESRVKGDWQGFFDTWVYGTDVPTYTWSWTCPKTAGPDGRYDLAVTVKESDVAPGFTSLVPVAAEFGTKAGTVFVLIDQPEKTFHISIPAPAEKVVFNPRHAVIARVKAD
jgi:hypothetical protein